MHSGFRWGIALNPLALTCLSRTSAEREPNDLIYPRGGSYSRLRRLMETVEPSAWRESFVLRCAPVPWAKDDPIGERYVRSYRRRTRNELDLTDTSDAALRVTLREAESISAEIRGKYGVEFVPHPVSS